jgi:hypothetical protein
MFLHCLSRTTEAPDYEVGVAMDCSPLTAHVSTEHIEKLTFHVNYLFVKYLCKLGLSKCMPFVNLCMNRKCNYSAIFKLSILMPLPPTIVRATHVLFWDRGDQLAFR